MLLSEMRQRVFGWIHVSVEHDVHESVYRDTTMQITNKMHYIDYFIIPSQLYMFRATFSPIIRST